MLIKAGTLKGYTLNSLDGEIGKVKEFYFDDQHWTIRYLVADTGNWLMDRQVLISPLSLVAVVEERQHIAIDLTRKQIEDSPSLDSEKPVSRQFEEAYYGYYGWPVYWGGPYVWGPYPHLTRERTRLMKVAQSKKKTGDSHLRSTHDAQGHTIQATDGVIGHLDDFIIDDETWTIRYLIIDTRNWWPGKKVLISPQWIERVSWRERKVFVNLSRDTIRKSPEYKEKSLLSRAYESRLHGHYDRQGYWVDEEGAKKRSR